MKTRRDISKTVEDRS